MDPQTTVAVGLTTVPWPTFRLPGWNVWSVGYHSDDGRVFYLDDGNGSSYGKPYRVDDVVGVGVNTADCTVFFTCNGVKLATVPGARVPAPRLAVHPAIGADSKCTLDVNFGTRPFKWEPANEGQFGYAINELPRYKARMASSDGWSFDAPLDHGSDVAVANGTRVTFYSGGRADARRDNSLAVVSNLPIPWIGESGARAILYFEVTIAAIDVRTRIAVGLTTVPWPSYRLPGWNVWSVGYHNDGRVYTCAPGQGFDCGAPFKAGDVVGVGVDTTNGSVFFTRNGILLEADRETMATVPAPRLAVHPAIGTDGHATLDVNFGTRPFKWSPANKGQFGYATDVPPQYS
ncbi:hypothetical protein H9P43_002502 [Blastocladiella emersonii ATCC 22665]|nr:hypothetical protein H9P43_002502 [Blastocladiella emersonii ATCC 22665]